MILVTGGTGLVGSHLLYKLAQNNERIRAIYRNDAKLAQVKKVFSYYTDNVEILFNKIEWVKTNLNNVPDLVYAFTNVTHVYHCAALISFDTSDFELLKKTNIEGTANIVNLCISEDIKKLCYVSSIATIGSSIKSVLNEESEWNPEEEHSVYALTKYGAELEVWRGTQEGLDAVIVNPGVIVGPGYWSNGSGLFFSKVAKVMRFYTSGVTGYIGVEDVVAVMLKLMESTIVNERYILVESHLSFKDFLTKIALALNVNPPKYEAKKWMLQMAWRLDWIKSLFTRKSRVLTKSIVESSQNKTEYNGSKLQKELNIKLEKIDIVISKTANCFIS